MATGCGLPATPRPQSNRRDLLRRDLAIPFNDIHRLRKRADKLLPGFALLRPVTTAG